MKRQKTFTEEDDKKESKRGEASLIQLIPLPLIKGKGIKGIGLSSKIKEMISYG